MQIIVRPDGSVRCVYDEAIDLHALGRLEVKRASHVEPNKNGQWVADLSPVCGPLLGPYEKRSVALDVERQWLDEHWLPYCEADSRKRCQTR